MQISGTPTTARAHADFGHAPKTRTRSPEREPPERFPESNPCAIPPRFCSEKCGTHHNITILSTRYTCGSPGGCFPQAARQQGLGMESRNDGGGGVGVGGGTGSSSRFISQIFWPEHCLSLGEDTVVVSLRENGLLRSLFGCILLVLLHAGGLLLVIVCSLLCCHGTVLWLFCLLENPRSCSPLKKGCFLSWQCCTPV